MREGVEQLEVEGCGSNTSLSLLNSPIFLGSCSSNSRTSLDLSTKGSRISSFTGMILLFDSVVLLSLPGYCRMIAWGGWMEGSTRSTGGTEASLRSAWSGVSACPACTAGCWRLLVVGVVVEVLCLVSCPASLKAMSEMEADEIDEDIGTGVATSGIPSNCSEGRSASSLPGDGPGYADLSVPDDLSSVVFESPKPSLSKMETGSSCLIVREWTLEVDGERWRDGADEDDGSDCCTACGLLLLLSFNDNA